MPDSYIADPPEVHTTRGHIFGSKGIIGRAPPSGCQSCSEATGFGVRGYILGLEDQDLVRDSV